MRIDFNEFYQRKEDEARNEANGDDGLVDEGMYGDESDEDDEEDDEDDSHDDGDDYSDEPDDRDIAPK